MPAYSRERRLALNMTPRQLAEALQIRVELVRTWESHPKRSRYEVALEASLQALERGETLPLDIRPPAKEHVIRKHDLPLLPVAERIKGVVQRHYNVSERVFSSMGRQMEIVKPRSVYRWLLHKRVGIVSQASRLAQCDHSTMEASLQRVENDPQLLRTAKTLAYRIGIGNTEHPEEAIEVLCRELHPQGAVLHEYFLRRLLGDDRSTTALSKDFFRICRENPKLPEVFGKVMRMCGYEREAALFSYRLQEAA